MRGLLLIIERSEDVLFALCAAHADCSTAEYAGSLGYIVIASRTVHERFTFTLYLIFLISLYYNDLPGKSQGLPKNIRDKNLLIVNLCVLMG
jgi:hypothetical protein